MNCKQKICLWLGICLIVLIGLFPPWVRGGTLLTPNDAGYHFIFTPPKVRSMECSRIDISRLFVQWVMVASITGGLVTTLKDKKN